MDIVLLFVAQIVVLKVLERVTLVTWKRLFIANALIKVITECQLSNNFFVKDSYNIVITPLNKRNFLFSALKVGVEWENLMPWLTTSFLPGKALGWMYCLL